MKAEAGTMRCPSEPTSEAIPSSGVSYRQIYGTWGYPQDYFPTVAITNTGETFRGVTTKKIKKPSNFIVLSDSYRESWGEQAYLIMYESSDVYLAQAKHSDRMNIAFIGGNVSPILPQEFKDTFNEMRNDYTSGGTTVVNVYYYDSDLVKRVR